MEVKKMKIDELSEKQVSLLLDLEGGRFE